MSSMGGVGLPGGPTWLPPGVQPPEYIPGGPSIAEATPGQIVEMGVGALIPALAGLAGWGIGELIGGADAGVSLGQVGYQAGVAGGGGAVVPYGMGPGMVPVSGPGVPEPPRAMVAKQWKTKSFSRTAGEYWVYFFKLIDGRIMCYNGAKKSWKIWRPKRPIVLYRGKVTLSQAVKTQRMLDKLWKTVAKRTKALKLA